MENKAKNFYNLSTGAHLDAKEDRDKLDYYASDPNNLVRFLDRIKEDEEFVLSNNIWEPACVDFETEFYNGKNWKKISEYVIGEKILCYNENGKGTLELPINYIKKYTNDSLYEWNSKSLSMCLTKDHRVVYKERRTNKLKVDIMENVIKHYDSDSNGFRGKIPTTFELDGDLELDEWYLRLAVACNADGRTRTKIKKTYEIRVKKERKKERLLWLLEKSGLSYKIHNQKCAPNYLVVTFESPYGCKEFPKNWLFLSKKCKEILIDEIVRWDGYSKNSTKQYSTAKKEDADLIQLICASINRHCNITTDNRGLNSCYTLNITDKVVDLALSKKHNANNLQIKQFQGYVYCFTVPSGMLILRRKDKIFITGNCGEGHLSEVLTSRGYEVFNTDIENRGYKNQHLTKDFFEFKNKYDGDILTNPPFSLAEKMIQHSLNLVNYGRYVIMFARIQLLEGTKRYNDLFSKKELKYVYVFSARARTAMGGNFGKYKAAPAMCYAWFVFQKGYLGEPILRWIK